MPKINPEEYESLKAFFVAWLTRFPILVTVTPESHPFAVLKAQEKKSMSKARKGLGLALNDIVEMSRDLTPHEVAAIDKDFSDQGIVTLSELRWRYSRQFRAILKRGKIRTESEYYLVVGVIASFTADASDEERKRWSLMIGDFENRGCLKNKTSL